MLEADVTSIRLKWTLLSVLVLAIAVFTSIGIVPAFSDTDRAMRDLKLFRTAGECLVDGADPYVEEVFSSKHVELTGSDRPARFSEPPQFSPFCMAFAVVPFGLARLLAIVLNLAAIVVVSAVAFRTCMAGGHFATRSIAVTAGVICTSFILIHPGTARLVEVGQVSLFAGAMALLAWWLGHFGERKGGWRPLVAGVALGLATIKPQFAIIPLVWLLLMGRWRAILTGSAISLVLAAPAALIVGPVQSVQGWLASLGAPGAIDNSYVVMGLPSLLASFDMAVPSGWMLILASAPLTAIVWLGRRNLVASDLPGILFGAQFALLFGKYVEIGLLAPMLGALILYGSWSVGRLVIILLGAASLFAPAFIFLEWDMPDINHFKTLVVLYGLVLLIVWSIEQARKLSHAAGGGAVVSG
jgi:hypothetical protein